MAATKSYSSRKWLLGILTGQLITSVFITCNPPPRTGVEPKINDSSYFEGRGLNVIGLAPSYIFLVNAVNDLLKEVK